MAIWETIENQVTERAPKVLVLSSEYFFQKPVESDFLAFKDRLETLSDDIELVLYVREPGAHHASRRQQGAKQGRPLRPIDGERLQREIPTVEGGFGRRVTVCAYERDQLFGGDVVNDFLERFVRPVVGEVSVPTMRLNESLSSEAASVLYRYARNAGIGSEVLQEDLVILREGIAKAEAEVGAVAPATLKTEVADAIRAATTDLLWLRDRYGTVFGGVDYAAVDGRSPDFDISEASFDDLFNVDRARLARLEGALLRESVEAWRELERLPRFLRRLSRIVARRARRPRRGPVGART